MRHRESWLATTMIELADTGAGGMDEGAYARGLAERLAELLSPSEIGLLIPAGAGRPAVATGSSDRAAGLARLEASGTAGLCTDCYRTGSEVRQESLAAERTRWPEFAAVARAAGLWMVFALPMRNHDDTIGAVGVLSARDHLIAAADVSLAQTLIEAAAIGIVHQRALRLSLQTTRQLQQALDSRVVIEQAKGAVAASLSCTVDDAFELLRAYSRTNGRRLTEVAVAVVGGALPARGLMVTGTGARQRAAKQ